MKQLGEEWIGTSTEDTAWENLSPKQQEQQLAPFVTSKRFVKDLWDGKTVPEGWRHELIIFCMQCPVWKKRGKICF